mmetsp:Transcript_22955/g.50455  ORF Transcript_22955/g.50455 Transcript_22955/m.50455 type:complete len:363 (+) Transcript_22955:3061-4149(+)
MMAHKPLISGHLRVRILRPVVEERVEHSFKSCVLVVGKTVEHGNKPVPQIHRLTHRYLGLSPPEPREMRDFCLRRMHSHDRHEGRHLVPPHQQLRGFTSAPETTRVAGHEAHSGLLPGQQVQRLALQGLPGLGLISSPHSRPEPLHARGVVTIDGEEALVVVNLSLQAGLRLRPPVSGVVGALALIIPPEIHPILQVVLHLLPVPVANRRDRIVQVPVAPVRLASRRDQPSLLPRHIQELHVAQPGLSDAPKPDVEVVVVPLQLPDWVGKSDVVVPEVLKGGRALIGQVVVRRRSVPLKIRDPGVDGKLAVSKGRQHRINILLVLPPPPAREEPKSILRRDGRGAGQLPQGHLSHVRVPDRG